jgi:hypothetical protein
MEATFIDMWSMWINDTAYAPGSDALRGAWALFQPKHAPNDMMVSPAHWDSRAAFDTTDAAISAASRGAPVVDLATMPVLHAGAIAAACLVSVCAWGWSSGGSLGDDSRSGKRLRVGNAAAGAGSGADTHGTSGASGNSGSGADPSGSGGASRGDGGAGGNGRGGGGGTPGLGLTARLSSDASYETDELNNKYYTGRLRGVTLDRTKKGNNYKVQVARQHSVQQHLMWCDESSCGRASLVHDCACLIASAFHGATLSHANRVACGNVMYPRFPIESERFSPGVMYVNAMTVIVQQCAAGAASFLAVPQVVMSKVVTPPVLAALFLTEEHTSKVEALFLAHPTCSTLACNRGSDASGGAAIPPDGGPYHVSADEDLHDCSQQHTQSSVDVHRQGPCVPNGTGPPSSSGGSGGGAPAGGPGDGPPAPGPGNGPPAGGPSDGTRARGPGGGPPAGGPGDGSAAAGSRGGAGGVPRGIIRHDPKKPVETEGGLVKRILEPLVEGSAAARAAARNRAVCIEAFPGMGKTALIGALVDYCRGRNIKVEVVAMRGTVARLSGGKTMAAALDLQAFDGFDIDSNTGAVRRNARLKAYNTIAALDVLILDEYEELSAKRIDVRDRHE